MKKHLLVLLVAFSLITCSKDEDPPPSLGSWTQLANFPGVGRNSGITFSLLGKGYWGLGGNTTNSFLRDMWAYDPATDSWEQKNDFPYDVPGETTVTINDKGYLITYSGALYEYNPVSDSWKYLSSFPTGNRPGITGFALGGNAYFGTGNGVVPGANGTYPPSKDFWKYDVSQNTWTPIDDFPGLARSAAVSFVVGEKAYVGLGFDGIGAPPIYTDVWRYDAATNKWDQVADFPESNGLPGILFSNDTKGYIGVPANNALHQGRMFEYDPAGNAWREIKTFPSGSSLETHSFFLDNRSFVIGGWWSEITSQVWEFVP